MEPQSSPYFTFKIQFLSDFSVLKNMSFLLEEEEDFDTRGQRCSLGPQLIKDWTMVTRLGVCTCVCVCVCVFKLLRARDV